MANTPDPFPKVGMGATIHYWSDRDPATVIFVSKSGKRIKIQKDTYKRIDDYGMSEMQSYLYKPNLNGEIYEVSYRKDGTFRVSKTTMIVTLGRRCRYYDYSF